MLFSISVIVDSLYMVFANAMGIWLGSSSMFPFLYTSMVSIVFHGHGMLCCL